MPKAGADNKENTHPTSLSLSAQGEIQKHATSLSIYGRGLAVKSLKISFRTVDYNETSKRAGVIARLLKQTPNLEKLELHFSGPLYKFGDYFGPDLTKAMCSLKQLKEFEHRATTAQRTDFGFRNILVLVSAWPNLEHLYLAGDTNGLESYSDIASPTCQIKTATFERQMAKWSELALLFAGSHNSLEKLECWHMCHESIAPFIEPLAVLENLTLSHVDTTDIAAISKSPKLYTLSIGGDYDYDGSVRTAVARALKDKDLFPELGCLEYPAQNYGRGRNAKRVKDENEYEEELLGAARERGVRAWRGKELEYKVEGAQKRAGFAAMGRKYGGW